MFYCWFFNHVNQPRILFLFVFFSTISVTAGLRVKCSLPVSGGLFCFYLLRNYMVEHISGCLTNVCPPGEQRCIFKIYWHVLHCMNHWPDASFSPFIQPNQPGNRISGWTSGQWRRHKLKYRRSTIIQNVFYYLKSLHWVQTMLHCKIYNVSIWTK